MKNNGLGKHNKNTGKEFILMLTPQGTVLKQT
jgi:hypothetical protein